MSNSAASTGPTPLAPLLAFAGLSSFAAGTATIGIFFVTETVFDFSAAANFALGLVVGVTYTAGALGAARFQRGLAARGVSARRTLVLLVCAMGLATLVPWLFPHPAAVFPVLAAYAPLPGLFWPLVESFLSGGRRGAELRTAVGRFNVVWSATLALGLWTLAPLLERASGLVFPLIALAHAASLAFVVRFRAEPGAHAPEDAHAYPASYPGLLRVHRVLHAAAYLVMYALSPLLPTLTRELGLGAGWGTLAASTWMLARVVTFSVLERWHGWHGRWSVATVGALLLLGGFAVSVLAPSLVPHVARAGAIATLLAGLCAFGVGIAALYTAALYYVLEVGAGGTAAGGSHEALIGLGYTVGPACGLAACALVDARWIAPERRDGVLLAAVAALSLGAGLFAWLRRAPRASPGD